MSFPEHDQNSPFKFPVEEEKVLAYWKEIDAFQEQLRQSKGRKPFVFMDGPPFATGLPHYGHLLAGTIKDIVTRFAHSNGYYVQRRFGWDCHGLPVEHEIDKKLGIKSKDDVMAMGIERYNAECRAIVMRYSSEWRQTVERIGRWIDFDNDYKTLNTTFMETVWWVFKQLWEKDLVYRGLRVMPYSTGCTTPLSNFEAGSDYRDVVDPAVTVAFPLIDDPSVSLLAWTTTPWTLPSNLALCVEPTFDYLKIYDEEKKHTFIICDKLLTTLYKDPKKAKFKKLETLKGKDLVGLKYEPLFPYFVEKYKDRAFKVVADPYVTSTAGTGIVHQAPAFGEDDHRIGIREGIVKQEEIPPCPIDESGRFTNEVPDFEGQHVKEADKAIQKYLKGTGRLIVQSTLTHSYPFCWRSGTPLIYRAIPVWFVRVESARDQLVANNKETRWVPAHVGESRFQNWLENARDWNVSRNRYWGTPLPLWVSDDMEEVVCVGSIEELDQLAGCGKLSDLHRDSVDGITIPSRKGKGKLRRVEEVFDCWFESGSMPYAQNHYPFENREYVEANFPADFICEGLDQTRGWFYTLLVLGTHLFGKAPWKNLICNGLVLAADGKKMSKSLKNYPDPNIVVNTYGADAVRVFLVNSPVVRAENLRFREEGVKEILARVMLPWLNSYRFFLGQVELLDKTAAIKFKWDAHAPVSENVMDRWILARCQSLIQVVSTEMGAYRLYTVFPRMLGLIDELTNWYIRFNRRRLKGEDGKEDAVAALNVLFETLLSLVRTLSAFTPFLTENIYQGLRKFLPSDLSHLGLGDDLRSVHFLPFPVVRQEYFDPVVERQVQRLQAVIVLARTVRDKHTLPLRLPLKEVVVYHPDKEYLDDVNSLSSYIKEELNIEELTLSHDEEMCGVRWKADADWPVLGRKLRKDMPKVKAGLNQLTSAQVKDYVSTGQITVAGIKLVEGDLTTHRVVEAPTSNGSDAKYGSDTDNDVIVLVDLVLRPEQEKRWALRDLSNLIQRLRKALGCKPTDELEVWYTFAEGESKELEVEFEGLLGEEVKRLDGNDALLKKLPQKESERSGDKLVLGRHEEDQTIAEKYKLRLAISKP